MLRPKREGVQLAEPLSGPKLAKLDASVLVQRKLNGDRCRTVLFAAEPYLVSSYGNEFRHLQHINRAIQEQWPSDMAPPDGELYKHGWRLEDIHSVASRSVNPHKEAYQLEYHIFDFQDEGMPQVARMAALAKMRESIKPPLFIEETEVLDNDIMLIKDVMARYVEEQYEGIIVRDLISPYTPRRIGGMLKFKPHQRDDYLIIGVMEGEGWCRGMLGAFLVQGDDGVTFEVGSGALLTKANRALLWKNRATLPGKVLTVKYEPSTTRHGKPKCAVAVGLGGNFRG